MSNKSFFYDKNKTQHHNATTKEILETIQSSLDLNKDCLVNVEGFSKRKSKTFRQLRGFHRLINILVSYFQEWTGENWDQDKVKDFIKFKNGFTMKHRGIEVTKSCKDATLKEMNSLIEEVVKFAAEMGIENCYLRGYEEKELIEFYSNI
jgi:hypothetical protein